MKITIKNTPFVIYILTIYAFIVGIVKLSSGLLSIYLSSYYGQGDILGFNDILNIIVGVLYLYLMKWIWKRDEQGRVLLYYFLIIDILWWMWNFSDIVIFLLSKISELTILLVITSIYSNLLEIAVLSFMLYIVMSEKTQHYFFK